MAKLRHIAIATKDPVKTAEFYKKAFEFREIARTPPDNPLAHGVFLSDGTINLAILNFHTDQLGKGMDFTGVHHFGVLVEDADEVTAKLEALGAECFMRPTPEEKMGRKQGFPAQSNREASEREAPARTLFPDSRSGKRCREPGGTWQRL